MGARELRVTGRFAMLCLLSGVAALASAGERLTVHQQLAKVRQDWIAAGRPAASVAALDSPEFGTDAMTAIEVQAYGFQPGISNDTLYDDGNGYRFYGAATADPYLAAAVQVPTGVVIDFLKFSGCQAQAGDFVLGLYDNGVAGAPSAQLGTLTTGTGFGCGNFSAEVNYTYTQSAHHPLYLVLYSANNTLDGTVKFGSAQIYYHRIVSPAPAAASFNDVPTNHAFFQFIEALKASGITGGCGASNYCPDNPVTRGQMAVFLAKALGLHWPY